MTQPTVNQPTADVSFALNALSPEVLEQRTVALLPASLQGLASQFYGHLGNARVAFEQMPQAVEAAWNNPQYPAEYRQMKAQEAKEQAFQRINLEVTAARDKLTTVRAQVKQALTPPLLGSPDLHELKMMNAREEVRTALEGLGVDEQVKTLVELFEEAYRADSASPIAFFIGATDSYKRLLRDPLARMAFEAEQQGMLARLLPATAQPYFQALNVLDSMEKTLFTVDNVRNLSARDNGVVSAPLDFTGLQGGQG